MTSLVKITLKNMPEILGKFNSKLECIDLDGDIEKAVLDETVDIMAMIEGEEVLCLFGLRHQRPGSAEAWVLPGEVLDRYKFTFFKTIYRTIDFVFEKEVIHRMEMALDSRWKEASKWASKLGFDFEGLARAYDAHKVDHLIFARIRV